MTINMVPLDSKKHQKLYLKTDPTYAQASELHMVPLVAFEFLKASSSYPIVFVKQQETGKFKSVALMGFEEGENVIFTQGKVNADYIPVNIRRYPFAAGGENPNDKDMILCLDENSDLINDSEGTPLFNDSGEPTEVIEQVSDFLIDLVARDQATDSFIDCLMSNDLIQPTELKVSLGAEGERKINGLYKIDEVALNNLTDEVALLLYKRQYFAAIYAHLGSLSQFKRLVHLKASLAK